MFRLGTMCNMLYHNTPDGRGMATSVEKVHAAGFNVMDLNLAMMKRRDGSEFNTDDWEAAAHAVGDTVARLGIKLVQAHLPYQKSAYRVSGPFDEGCEQNGYFVSMMYRAIDICAMLGVPWAVVHPVWSLQPIQNDVDADIAYNHFIFDKYVEYSAARGGPRLAFENMTDVDGRRFGTTAWELNAIRRSYGDNDEVGICWDFGHANHMFKNQCTQLERIGSHLKCTHVQDNVGLIAHSAAADLHTLPYLGNVDWTAIMKTLVDIGYDGGFIYEVRLTSRLPEEVCPTAMRLALEVGEHMMGIAENYARRKAAQ